MVLSQNGWTVVDTGTSPDLTVLPWVTGRVRSGDVHVVLAYLCRRFNAEVEPIDKASSWGYANRAVRGAADYSNHASGTAVDFNAPRHPLAAVGTFTAAQRAAIGRILADLEGVVRWGGNYAGRKDEMHFEVIGRPSDVARVAARILAGTITRGQVTPAPLTKDEDMPLNDTDLTKIAAIVRRELPPAVWEFEAPVLGAGGAAGALGSAREATDRTANLVADLRADVLRADAVTRGQLTALVAAVGALAGGAGLDADAVLARIDAAVDEALAGLTITLTTPEG